MKQQATATKARIFRFRPMAEIISELGKVTWPSTAETRYLTFIVIVVSLAVGIVLGGIDKLFDLLIRGVLVR
jgi:preprotein translocase SecE subunit